MKRLGTSFIGEDLSAAFSRIPALRSYMGFAAVMAGVLLVWWPRSPLSTYLRSGIKPDTFMAAALGLLCSAVYLGIRFGSEDFAGDDSSKIHDFVTLTPVPVAVVVAGKLAAAVLHTLFVLLLGFPFLVVGSSVNGTPVSVMCRAVLIMGVSALAFRSFAFMTFAFCGHRKILKNAIILICAAAWLSVTTAAAPAFSPISALLCLDPGNPMPMVGLPLTGGAVPRYVVSLCTGALGVAVFSVLSMLALNGVRRAHAARKAPAAQAGSVEPRAQRLMKGLWDDADDEHKDD